MSKQYLNGVPYGVSMPYRELTQAEYDTLPDSKNNDGIMYFIKNAGVAGGIKMFALADIYDTNEREIGVWTDGKPLYQKVIDCNFTISSTSWYNTQIACPDLDTLIFGRAIDSDNQSWAITVGTYTNPSKTIGIRMAIADSGGSTLKKLIIQYTKTTDVPGSGSLTPQGTPTHHYNTDEHVIGTWIDGKPLYEKVFNGTLPSQTISNYKLSDLSSMNIDKMIAVFGTLAGVTPINAYYDNSLYSMVFTNNAKTGLYINGNGLQDGLSYEIILQYTKTTD